MLEAAGEGQEVPTLDLQAVGKEREEVVTIVSRLARDSTFRRRVLLEYKQSCAVCEMQLNMAQAHIIPVIEAGSTDETSNGLSLWPLHHIGYDRAIMGVMPDYTVAVSRKRLAELERWG